MSRPFVGFVSDRLSRTTSKEQYAYFYNTQTMQQIGNPYTYPDSNDLFQREPYVAEFKARNGNFDFVLITIHTDSDTATQEINDLPAVVENAKGKYQGEGDFILMGDLNADCDYFNENSVSPLRSADYLGLSITALIQRQKAQPALTTGSFSRARQKPISQGIQEFSGSMKHTT